MRTLQVGAIAAAGSLMGALALSTPASAQSLTVCGLVGDVLGQEAAAQCVESGGSELDEALFGAEAGQDDPFATTTTTPEEGGGELGTTTTTSAEGDTTTTTFSSDTSPTTEPGVLGADTGGDTLPVTGAALFGGLGFAVFAVAAIVRGLARPFE